MAYQVFALRWRPQTFDQIVGQDHVANLLKNSIENGRLAHAYLFSGPRGVGKTSCARILSKSLNCQKGPTVTPCQKCSSCQGVTQCRSLDVIEIDGASNRGIDEIRALRESVKFASSGGKFKIYIIDEVHMLTNEAFNALLKTLEEPPEFVKFIFATTQVNRIPATILSRCQRLDFHRIQVSDIINQLKKIIREEKISLDDEVLFTIARVSEGSLRDAESILDQLYSFNRRDKNISISDVSSLLGVLEQDVLFELTDKIVNKDACGILNLLNIMLRQGKDTKVILSNIIEHFRNLIVAKISQADSELIDLPEEIIKNLILQSQHFSLEDIFLIFNILVNTQETCKRMNDSVIPLEISLVRLTQQKKTGHAQVNAEVVVKQANISKAVGVKQKAETDHQPAAVKKPQANKDDGAAEIKSLCKEVKNDHTQESSVKQRWARVIEDLGKLKISVASFLSEGIPSKLENSVLTVSFPKGCSLHKETLEKKENRLLVEKILSDLFSKNLRVKFDLCLSESKKKPDRDKADDSFLRSAMSMFNARLV